MAGPDDADELDPRERERARRRDRDASTAERELMRTGQAKLFKQVLDRQALRAEEPVARRRRRGKGGGPAASRPDEDR